MVGKYKFKILIFTIVENELILHKSLRNLKNRTRSLSREQVSFEREPEPKKVVFAENDSQLVTQEDD